MTFSELIIKLSTVYHQAKLGFMRTLKDSNTPEVLCNALHQEAILTLRYLLKLAKSNLPDPILQGMTQEILQARLAYIKNTHAASIDSPMNTLSLLIGNELGFNFLPQTNDSLTMAGSAEKLNDNRGGYFCYLRAITLPILNSHERSEFLLQAIQLRKPRITAYILSSEKDDNLYRWAEKILRMKIMLEDRNFLIVQYQALNRSPAGFNDFYSNFEQICLENGVELTDACAVLSLYIHCVADAFRTKPSLTPVQAEKLNKLELAIEEKNMSTGIDALHLPEAEADILTDPCPECIQKMPNFVVDLLDILEDNEGLSLSDSSEGGARVTL